MQRSQLGLLRLSQGLHLIPAGGQLRSQWPWVATTQALGGRLPEGLQLLLSGLGGLQLVGDQCHHVEAHLSAALG